MEPGAKHGDVHERGHLAEYFDLSIPELWGLIDEAKEEADRIRSFMDMLHEIIAEKMEDKEQTIPGFGRIRKGRSANRKWDHDSLYSRAIRYADEHRVLDTETGEIEDSASALLRYLKRWMAPSYWRITELKAAGIDPDEYAETTWGPVRITRVTREEG